MVLGFVFLTGFFTIIAVFTQERLLVKVGMVRWAAAAGAGAGVLVGIFEARAIERAVAAPRTQIRNGELQRQNDRLEEFASIVSHDLRNPLNVIGGHLELVRDETDSEYLDEIEHAHDHMQELIGDLLALAVVGR